MNSAALLDLLGNENRRRILRLLARKPCYVTEISDYLGVSPKAVIDHLRKLEEAGLVESHVDDQRRKYFHIARNVRLEVNVSPYRFGTKSAYPASVSLDLTRWRHLSIDADGASGDTDAASDGRDADEGEDAGPDASPSAMARQLREYEELEEELSMAQRWVQGRLTETLDQIGDVVEENTDSPPEVDSRLYADILLALEERPLGLDDLAGDLEAAPGMIQAALDTLGDAGLVVRRDDRWRLADE